MANDGITSEQAAKKLRVPEADIRLWAKKGLVKTARSAKGEKLYVLADLKKVKAQQQSGKATPFRVLKRRGKPTDFSVIELFAGCGGMALGMANAGLNTELLVEWDKHACATLRKNWPAKKVIEGDVAKVDFTPYADAIDVVAGGFPCQAFSYAGEGKGFGDIRGTMFFQFARCVEETRPKIALGENVRGLLQHDGGRTLETMLEKLRDLGYRPQVKLLRAQFLDVPQKRERLIIIGVREDLAEAGVEAIFPEETGGVVTLREALKDVPESVGQEYGDAKAAVMRQVPEGGYWRDLPDAEQRAFMKGSYHLGGGKTGMARRLAWDEPSLTLTCSPSQKQTERCHPEHTRPLTTREYARIQSFPDDWQFAGPVTSVYKQIGNAVPINLGYHVGRCLLEMLDGQEPATGAEQLELGV